MEPVSPGTFVPLLTGPGSARVLAVLRAAPAGPLVRVLTLLDRGSLWAEQRPSIAD
jgi:hypothetical protein